MILVAAAALGANPGSDAFLAEWRQWHQKRVEALKRPQGWLALTGLHWLEPGDNRVDGLPGVFRLGPEGVSLPEPAGWTLNGAPVPARALGSDRDGRPERIANGPRALQVIDRGGKVALRVWDANNPLRNGLTDIPTYPPNPRWRVVARWEAYATPRDVEVPSVVGIPAHEHAPGRAWFAVEGKEYALEPTVEDGALFFVFKDRTAPKETYGGGRFLGAPMPEGDKVTLDFNRAYNPPCVFTLYATCPLPLPENTLPVRIEAGERNWTEGGHAIAAP
jgi:uncharacterized protein